MGAKFRVAVVNKCNMNCFFCHNEGMKNPRFPGDKTPIKRSIDPVMSTDKMIKLMNDFCELGGRQLNITGGEPLVHKEIVHILKSVNKRNTTVILNSNVMLAEKLLAVPKIETVDAIYASLHTTSDEIFKTQLGVPGANLVMNNILALKKHGYKVQINYSHGEFNKDGLGAVLDYVIKNEIGFKSITLIRSDEDKHQYGEGKDWSDPEYIANVLEKRGLERVGRREGFGGYVTTFKTPSSEYKIEVKNIGQGRLQTDYCNGCKHQKTCGEGIYAMRSGPDGIWKPCLLNHEKFSAIDYSVDDFKPQILNTIEKMVGDWKNHKFVKGNPQ
jgi:molybdenum cofactor biosynthesis enzyme MoaA